VKISVIVPAFNEAANIVATLSLLQSSRAKGLEVIVVDGGSVDDTVRIAGPLADRVLTTPAGRARQMNAGAALAQGDVLLFLHADTQPPEHCANLITRALTNNHCHWGRFDVKLSGAHTMLRVVECLMNWRSRLTSIATGDQAMFVRRDVFIGCGGFPDIPLMEDIALSKMLKRCGSPANLREHVVTSSRQWERRGIVKTILMMWRLRFAYAMGADPQVLYRRYYEHQNNAVS
jgi:rSAM/selenodomain-associated transferase 2